MRKTQKKMVFEGSSFAAFGNSFRVSSSGSSSGLRNRGFSFRLETSDTY